jgi:Rieske Fe-S protein
MNRKQFLLLTAAAATGCETTDGGGGPVAGRQPRMMDAGPAGNYATDGVYETFRHLGFFIVRKGGNLSAISAICTHRRCKLEAEPDRSFYCPCHGSTFDPAGKVTKGPATRDLPILPWVRNDAGHLIVTLPA